MIHGLSSCSSKPDYILDYSDPDVFTDDTGEGEVGPSTVVEQHPSEEQMTRSWSIRGISMPSWPETWFDNEGELINDPKTFQQMAKQLLQPWIRYVAAQTDNPPIISSRGRNPSQRNLPTSSAQSIPRSLAKFRRWHMHILLSFNMATNNSIKLQHEIDCLVRHRVNRERKTWCFMPKG